MLSRTILKLSGDDRLYDKCFQSLLQSDCVAGVSWLNPRGCPLYERRLDQHLPAGKEGDGLGLVSAAEGRQLTPQAHTDSRLSEGKLANHQPMAVQQLSSRPTSVLTSRHLQLVIAAQESLSEAEAVKGLTDEGICREGSLSCVGTSFQAFGGSPLGIFAVGPGKRLGMIVRSLPSVGILVVFYRRPHMPQEVVPFVEKFVDTLWANVRGLR